jgi:hypothetical protein
MTTYTSEPGTRLGGRYRLEDRIAAGPGWAAWKAIDETLARAVTVFTFAQGFPRVGDVVTAARVASRLTDPRLAQVFDVEDAWDRAYIVMEWAAGETLSDMLSSGPLDPSQAGRMIADVAAALSSAHAAGAAHMCLSPGSVRWSQTGEVKVVGLGIDAALSGVVAEDPVLADTVGLGRLLYAALTGYWPGPEYSSLPPAPLLDGQPRSPHQVVAGVPLALSDLTGLAMQSRPRDGRDGGQLTTADQLVRALRSVLPPAPPPPAFNPPGWQQGAARPGRRRGSDADDEYWSDERAGPDDRAGRAPSWRDGPDEQRSGGQARWSDDTGPGRARAGRRRSRQAGMIGPLLLRLRQALSGPQARRPVVIVAAAGVLVVLAIAAFTLLPGGGSPAIKTSNKPTKPTVTAVTTLHIQGATGFDPLTSPANDSGNENTQYAPYAIDRDPHSFWYSQYYASASFGGLKNGSGLILDMGHQVTATSVTVTFGPTPGAHVELLVGKSDERSKANLASMSVVASATSPTGTTVFSIAKPQPGRFLVIWFTRLPPKPKSSKWFMAEIFNVVVKGT